MTTQDPRGTYQTGTMTSSGTTEVRGRATDDFVRDSRAWRETKPSFLTTEFWAMLVGIVALVVTYNVADNPVFDLWRMCLLCTGLASAYIVSRGWAKSGSRDSHEDTRH